MRDEFTEEVKRTIAARVGYVCSNPDCRARTSGPQVEATRALNVGVAAHITAASPGGARYDESTLPEERRHADNGIWLCQNCAKLVDNDADRFPSTLLREWKARAEKDALSRIGKTAGPHMPSGRLRFELPAPINPVGYQSAGGVFTGMWSVRVRLIAEGPALDVLEIGLTEEGVGEWVVDEVFREKDGMAFGFPIPVERSTEFWIRARSPIPSNARTKVGRMTFRVRDHTQSAGECYEYVVDEPPQS